MKPFLKFLAIFCSVLLLSAFLAPLLFQFLPFKFERIFNRLVMIFSLAALFLFARFRAEDFRQWKLTSFPEARLSLFLRGFAAVWIVLLALTGVRDLFDDAGFELADWPQWQYGFQPVKALFSALLIALIEEVFFRGIIYNHLKSRFRWPLPAAIFATTLFYSLIHFVSANRPLIGPEPNFFDSLTLIAAPLVSLTHISEYWPAAVGLFIFGLALILAVERTGSLFPAMGVHAGAVFFIKSDNLFVDFFNLKPFWFGTDKQYDGVLGWFFLALLSLLLVWVLPSAPKMAQAKRKA